MDGECRQFNGLAASVCKICTRPFAFSFAFVPVREPQWHRTKYDPMRPGTLIYDQQTTNLGVSGSNPFGRARNPLIIGISILARRAPCRFSRVARRLHGVQQSFAGLFADQPQCRIEGHVAPVVGVDVMQGGYRGLVRLTPFLSAVRPARRKASASAPPAVGSF